MKTISEDLKICTLTIQHLNVQVSLYELDTQPFNSSRRYYGYTMYHNGKLLFEGNDYSPSPMIGPDSLDSVIELMEFLTLQPGDTDEDYFDKYTPEQMLWALSAECEELHTICGYLQGLSWFDLDEEEQTQLEQDYTFEQF